MYVYRHYYCMYMMWGDVVSTNSPLIVPHCISWLILAGFDWWGIRFNMMLSFSALQLSLATHNTYRIFLSVDQ